MSRKVKEKAATMKKLPSSNDFIVKLVTLKDLKIDSSYQRGLQSNHKRIAKNFDAASVGMLHVANRDNGLWLVDGQQRVGAMLLLGIKEWEALIIPSTGSEYEATIYRMLNGKDRKQLSKQELFKACLVAKDPVALAVQRACESVGWKLKLSRSGSKGWPEVACVGTLYNQCQKYGEELLTRALRLIENCWPQCNDNVLDVVPAGFCQFLRVHGSRIEEGRLINALQNIPPRKILLEITTILTNRQNAFTQTLVKLYNKKVSSKFKLKINQPVEINKAKVS